MNNDDDDEWLRYSTGEVPAIGDTVAFISEYGSTPQSTPLSMILPSQKRVLGHGWFGAPYLMRLVSRGSP